MYELLQAGARTCYLNCPAKIGIYRMDDTNGVINGGNDKEAAKKIMNCKISF